jgi:hypothetical protein
MHGLKKTLGYNRELMKPSGAMSGGSTGGVINEHMMTINQPVNHPLQCSAANK